MGLLAGIELGGMHFSEQGCAIGQEAEPARRSIALTPLHGSVHNLYYSILINLIELAGDPMTTRVVTAHIPDALAEKLDLYAERHDRPKGWVVKQALEQYVLLEERRDQLTREGLVDLRAGRIVDHAAIEMWATTLTATKAVKRRK